VDALISLGLAHFKAGNQQSAVKFLEDALDMFQYLSGDDASAHSAKALCLDHLGAVYSSIGKPDKAVTFYTMSLRVKKDIGDMTGEARCLVRIGLEFLLLDQLTRAFEAFTEALHMFERLEDDNGISICYENLGDTYMKMGEKKQAIFSYDRCLPIKVETWDKVGEAQCLDNLALAHYAAGELRLAAEYYEQSLAIWRAERDKQALMLCYERCACVWRRRAVAGCWLRRPASPFAPVLARSRALLLFCHRMLAPPSWRARTVVWCT
jgi:tetratricopeptide (TPR) repeat protein